MVIGVDAIAGVLAAKRLSGIERHAEAPEHPHFVGVLRIDPDLTVIARTRIETALPRPRRTSIVGSVDAAGCFVLDDRVDGVRMALRDLDADAAERP